jgi:hypothetical protein
MGFSNILQDFTVISATASQRLLANSFNVMPFVKLRHYQAIASPTYQV